MRALTLASLLLLPLISSADVPRRMTWHGRLARADGSAETNPQSLKFALYTASTGGAPVWEETLSNVPVVNGAYAVVLGQATPLPASVVNGQDLFLGLSLNGGAEQQPRVRVSSVPYALTAADAHTLEGHPAADFALTAHVHATANATTDGFMSKADWSKLNGLNAAAFATAGHGHATADATTDGFMSKADWSRLDALDIGKPYAAANHSHAAYATTSHSHDASSCAGGASSASQCTAGFLSAADKFKLDKYPSTPAASPALTCTYVKAVEKGSAASAVAKCPATDKMLGSACATVNKLGILLSGFEPVNVTSTIADPSSTGPGNKCQGTGTDVDDEVHAWAFCCKL